MLSPLQTTLSPRIAIVEDDRDLLESTLEYLTTLGYSAWGVGSAEAFYKRLAVDPIDVVVLDIGLPGENGLSIAARLRQAYPSMSIIMLTARGELDSRLHGYKQGADIYLVKPIDWRELLAQIHALHRRMVVLTAPTPSNEWVLKQAGRELVTPQGHSISLTHMESLVLNRLAQHAGQPVERALLMSEVLGEQAYQLDPRRLEVCISRLRQKMLAAMGDNNDIKDDQLPLKTVRGTGYIFTQAIHIHETSHS